MKVMVDATKCDGFGLCAEHCPDVFKLDDFDYAFVEGDGTVPAGQEELAQRAIVDCPVNAIRTIE